MRAGQRRVATEIDFNGRSEPAQIVAVRSADQERGFGEVHLARDVLHPGGFSCLRKNADGGGVAGKGAVRERVDLGDTKHDLAI